MIYSCKYCGAAMVYDPETDQMICENCHGAETEDKVDVAALFEEPDANVSPGSGAKKIQVTNEYYSNDGQSADDMEDVDNTMEVYAYQCEACAAKFYLYSEGGASVCAFCGAPNVVPRTKEKMTMPKLIIPFDVSKEQAVKLIQNEVLFRQKLGNQHKRESKDPLTERKTSLAQKASMMSIDEYREKKAHMPKKERSFIYDLDKPIDKSKLPNGIRSISPSQLVGIYVPYYYLRENLSAFSSGAKNKLGNPVSRSCTCETLVGASSHLQDFLTKGIQSYDLSDLVPFDPQYLSGYYADYRDAKLEDVRKKAREQMLDKGYDHLFTKMRYDEVRRENTSFSHEFAEEANVLLPIYFLIYNDEGEKNMICVNGQTGKVLGYMNNNKVNTKKTAIKLACIAMPIYLLWFGYLGYCFQHSDVTANVIYGKLLLMFSVFPFFGAIVGLVMALKANQNYVVQNIRSKDEGLRKFVRRGRE